MPFAKACKSIQKKLEKSLSRDFLKKLNAEVKVDVKFP